MPMCKIDINSIVFVCWNVFLYGELIPKHIFLLISKMNQPTDPGKKDRDNRISGFESNFRRGREVQSTSDGIWMKNLQKHAESAVLDMYLWFKSNQSQKNLLSLEKSQHDFFLQKKIVSRVGSDFEL